METPNNSEGRLTEAIMLAIREHIHRDSPPQENHHYNRAWEKVYKLLRSIHCTRCSSGTFEIWEGLHERP